MSNLTIPRTILYRLTKYNSVHRVKSYNNQRIWLQNNYSNQIANAFNIESFHSLNPIQLYHTARPHFKSFTQTETQNEQIDHKAIRTSEAREYISTRVSTNCVEFTWPGLKGKKPITFRFAHDDTLSTLLSALGSEISETEEIKLLIGTNHIPGKLDMRLLSILLQNEIHIILPNDIWMTLTMPEMLTTHTYADTLSDTHGSDIYLSEQSNSLTANKDSITLEQVLRRGAYSLVRRELELRPARTISFSEFMTLGAKHGLRFQGAEQLLRSMNNSGLLYYFPQHHDASVRNTIFLCADEITDRLHGQVGLEGPTQRYIAKERTRKERELADLKTSLLERRSQLAIVEDNATKWTRLFNQGVFVTLLSGTGLYAWLAFDYLSWDIMEPVTYFTATGFTIVGYFWWLLTRQEFRYESLADHVREWSRKRSLKAVKDATEREMSPEQLVASVNALQEAKQQARAQLELLDVTKFDPSLVQAYEAEKVVTTTSPLDLLRATQPGVNTPTFEKSTETNTNLGASAHAVSSRFPNTH